MTHVNFEELTEARDLALVALAGTLVDGDQPAINKARKAVEQAQQAIEDAEIVSNEMLRRDEAAKVASKAAQVRQAWGEVERLSARRLESAKQIEHHAQALGRHYADLLKLTNEICENVPTKVDENAGLLLHPSLCAAVREQLQMHGALAGMPQLPFSNWELQRRPVLSARIAAGNDALIRRAGK